VLIFNFNYIWYIHTKHKIEVSYVT
jgi:hypothetical protein